MKTLTLLFPTEFGPLAEKARSNVMYLSQLVPTRLILMHAIYPLKVDEVAHRAEVFAQLEGYQKELGLGDEPSIINAVRAAAPDQAIVTLAADLHAGMIVLGTKGGHGLMDSLLGSKVNRVIRSADCPVLTIRKKPEVPGFARILVPVDLEEDTSEQIDWAIGLAKLYKAEIEFFSLTRKNHDEENGWLKEKLENAVRLAKLNGVVAGSSLEKGGGSAADKILAHADKIDSDLICLMTQRLSEASITKSLLGSVSDKVVNKSKRAVISIRPGSDRSFLPPIG